MTQKTSLNPPPVHIPERLYDLWERQVEPYNRANIKLRVDAEDAVLVIIKALDSIRKDEDEGNKQSVHLMRGLSYLNRVQPIPVQAEGNERRGKYAS